MATMFTCHLTPIDFFFWGIVKNKIYERYPHTVNELKNYISDAITEMMVIGICVILCVKVLWTDMKIVARLKVDILSI